MSDEDRDVAAEAGDRSRRPRATARATGCGSSRTTRRRTTATTTWSRTRRSGSSSTTSGSSRSADLEHGSPPRVGRGLRRGQPRLRRRGRSRSSSASRTRRSSSTTTTSTSRRAFVRERRPGRGARALHPHPVGRAGRLARAAGADRPRDPRGAARQRRRRLPHRALAASCVPATSSARRRLGLGRRTSARVTAHPISVDPAEFDELAASEPVLGQERELVAERPEQLILRVDRTDPSKNIAAGLRGVRAAARAPSRAARPRRHARAARPVAAGDPRVRRVPRRDRGGGRGGRTTRFRRVAPSTCASPTTSRRRSRRTSSSTSCS